MLWGFNITVTEENMIDSHAHDIHEFVICRSNTGTIVVNGETYDLSKGLSVYLPGGVPHQTIGSKKAPAEIDVVAFDQQSLIKYTTPEVQHVIMALGSDSKYINPPDDSNTKESKELLRLSEILVKELSVIKPLNQTMAGSILTQLLIHHCRSLTRGFTDKEDNYSKEISKICDYIKTHPDSQISLDQMAKKSSMSRTLFCTNFKKYTGMSLIEFTINTRINNAIQLLGKTEKKIAEIAFECGFNNIGHFTRTFRKKANMTPLQYRELTKAYGVPFPIINFIE